MSKMFTVVTTENHKTQISLHSCAKLLKHQGFFLALELV